MPHYSSSNDEPLKPLKHSLSPRSKFTFSTTNILKLILLAICIIAFLSFCYSSYSAGTKWGYDCPGCDPTSVVHASFEEFNQTGTEIWETERIGETEPLIERKGNAKPKGKGETTISHLLFGIGAATDTWSRRRHYCELWWKPNVTRGYVWIDKEPTEWPETSPPYRVSEDTMRFRYTSWGSRSAVRIARIVKESFELGLNNVRWFVMGDDDSVFFPENLVNVLNKYDHNSMYYIGGNSESVEQDIVHSYSMAYGGGGFAISYPLAAELVKILDGCIDRYSDMYGSDQKVGACVTEIGVPLTKELGFHQLDIRGSPYGILSTHPLAPLVSLHHLDYLQPLFPGINRVDSIRKLIQGYRYDPLRELQHTFCHDLTRNWSISISWGYTLQVYPFLLSAKELNTPLQTFLTWGTWSQEPFTFDTRPMALEPCERPVLYYLDGVAKSGNGKTLSQYSRSKAVRWKPCDKAHYRAAYSINAFNVSAGVLDAMSLQKAPRRQCCEVMNSLGHRESSLRLRIRGCKKGESVTIPY